MRRNQSSLTASGIAMLRALESEKPAGERLFYDPYARQFTPGWVYWMGKIFTKLGYAEFRGPGVLGFLVARERYIDDALEAAVGDGIRQVVILGAGYDARAYRFRELLQGVKVFEVDHPATQPIKLDRLKKIFGNVPEYVCYVGIDFNTQSLEDRLLQYGYEPSLKTFFIWQGVTQYLTPEAVDGTLAFVRQCSGAGSAIVFDYVDRRILETPGKHGEVSNLRRYRRFTGESLEFGLSKEGVKEFLESRGFVQVSNAVAADFQRLYFSVAPRPASDAYGIALGVVPG